ncbi:MAG: glycosyltransferase family 4 protein [Chloroflexaceae bacterium]|nr:glycosyltransferase family 4 protein [Chloroflexaceae bacterium]
MICYIAIPTSLTLQSANALQTFATLRELRARRPDTLGIMPRWGREPSRFAELGVVHLPRPAIGKLSRLYRSTLWYYLEYSAFAWMCLPVVLEQMRAGHRIEAVYIRQSICAAWWSGVIAPRLGNIPVIYEVHDLESRNPSRTREAWAQSLLHLIDRTALTRSAAVASLTDDFRHYLAGIGWRDRSEVAIIPDAYDDRLFAPQDTATCRDRLHLPAEAEIVAYAGMTFAHRWLDGLLEAAARLVPEHPRLHLVLVGGRPAEVDALRVQAAQLGIAERVLLTGPRPQAEVVHYLNAADALVIPDTVTDMTASPLKLFEYLALGQPLVLPDLPALREIVPPALAHYFPRRNLPAFVNVLSTALHARNDTARIAARRALAYNHTYGRRAERILALVEQVAQQEPTLHQAVR